MNQLDLFLHAPRHYHEALHRLGALDLAGCREALAAHRRSSSAGPDAWPVEVASSWLEARLEEGARAPGARGRVLLGACREVGEGRAPAEILAPTGETAGRVLRALARRGLQAMAERGLRPGDPVDEDLPWGVFLLWAGDPATARRALLANAKERDGSPLAWLALGDACWASRWPAEAWGAYREGFGLDPSGRGWRPACPEVAELPRKFASDPVFPGPWWAVGAYLEGAFPAVEPAPPAVLARRWVRFWQGCGDGPVPEPETAAAFFYAGLFLSEQGLRLPAADLRRVRETLRRLHPEAWEIHREQLEEPAPRPAPHPGPPALW